MLAIPFDVQLLEALQGTSKDKHSSGYKFLLHHSSLYYMYVYYNYIHST